MRMFRTLREKKTISNYVVSRICLLHLQLEKNRNNSKNKQLSNLKETEMETEEKHTTLSVVTTIRTSLILPIRSMLW